MKRKRFSVEQIAAALRQHAAGLSLAELVRKLEVSEQTFYRWKEKHPTDVSDLSIDTSERLDSDTIASVQEEMVGRHGFEPWTY